MSQEIPATRQSLVETMACESGYKLIYIDGLKTPNTTQSDRGTDIHEVLAQYVTHCASRRVQADFMYLDSLLGSATEEVSTSLESCRDNITVDWQNLFAVEILCGLDRDFRPTYALDHDGKAQAINPIWGIDANGTQPAYCHPAQVNAPPPRPMGGFRLQ